MVKLVQQDLLSLITFLSLSQTASEQSILLSTPVVSDQWQPVYDTSQVAAYLDTVRLPSAFRPESNPALDLELLKQLHLHHITTFPYENLILHYSHVREISLEPQGLFKKMVTDGRGRGGYCVESTLLFLHVLQALGYDVYPTGVRIRYRVNGVPEGNFTGFSHIVLIVTIKTREGLRKYVSDPAFGGDGSTVPLPLVENQVTLNFGTQEIRFIRRPLPQLQRIPRPQTTSAQDFWQYQYRNGTDKPWRSFYAFVETEYLVEDFTISNAYTSSWLTYQRKAPLVVKFIRGFKENGEAYVKSKYMLVADEVKRNLGGRTELVKVCRSEDERIEALKGVFGINLTEDEVKGIHGLVSEIQEIKDVQVTR